MEALLAFDRALFEWINSGWSNPVFDVVLPYCREKLFWAPLYLFVVVFAWLNHGIRGWWIIGGLVLSVGLADFTSSTLIKKNVQRVRPCRDPALHDHMVLRVSCGGGYSFTSSHAANHFAAAVFLIGVLGPLGRWVRYALPAWAALIALAQVYVGVHYPLDVLGGAVVGSVLGWLVGAVVPTIPRSA
jgi:membrane-associated phospholipid phosphatase